MAREIKKTATPIVAGVAGGIANYLNIDPTLVRVILVLTTILGGCGLIIYFTYLLCWLIMPKQEESKEL
ncbi:MAG: PspC domain-containing protein [Paludibacteraceae bacterium]|nr:PspC domain-containing protein [Paludibacteraceae bacterium]